MQTAELTRIKGKRKRATSSSASVVYPQYPSPSFSRLAFGIDTDWQVLNSLLGEFRTL
jgi:hypothetical protein